MKHKQTIAAILAVLVMAVYGIPAFAAEADPATQVICRPIESATSVTAKEILIDGTPATASVFLADGSINYQDPAFANGAEDAYLLTVDGKTTLVGDTSLKDWEGSWENWQNYIEPSDTYTARYPKLEEAWKQASKNDRVRETAFKKFWLSCTKTSTCENKTPVDQILVEGNTVTWKDAKGNVLAKDTYSMVGKVLKGLEGATMYVFQADTLSTDSPFRYWVTMKGGMEGTPEQPIAAHYHFQYGSDLNKILKHGPLYTGTESNLRNRLWFATMIDASASDTAKYNVILALHKADKWNA